MHYEIQISDIDSQVFLAKRGVDDNGNSVELSSDELDNIVHGLEALCRLLKMPGIKIVVDRDEIIKHR